MFFRISDDEVVNTECVVSITLIPHSQQVSFDLMDGTGRSMQIPRGADPQAFYQGVLDRLNMSHYDTKVSPISDPQVALLFDKGGRADV